MLAEPGLEVRRGPAVILRSPRRRGVAAAWGVSRAPAVQRGEGGAGVTAGAAFRVPVRTPAGAVTALEGEARSRALQGRAGRDRAGPGAVGRFSREARDGGVTPPGLLLEGSRGAPVWGAQAGTPVRTGGAAVAPQCCAVFQHSLWQRGWVCRSLAPVQ